MCKLLYHALSYSTLKHNKKNIPLFLNIILALKKKKGGGGWCNITLAEDLLDFSQADSTFCASFHWQQCFLLFIEARSDISKIEKRFESWQIQMCGRRGRGGKMPNLPQSLTTQEPASLTGEGLPLDSEAPLRECSESLQAKYLINDSQQTHIKSTHTPPPSSAGPQRNWIKCTPSAIPPTGPRAKNSSTSCTYNTRTHTSMQTHIYTQPKWGCSYINADRMQPTPMGCTAIPYMHFFYILKMSRSPLTELQLVESSI